MPMNRVQFQPGLSMFEFLQRYGTEDKCEAAVAAARWPQGFACPRCSNSSTYAFRRGRQPYRECAACGYQCSLIAGTMFEASKLALTRWYMAMQLLSQAENNPGLRGDAVRRRRSAPGPALRAAVATAAWHRPRPAPAARRVGSHRGHRLGQLELRADNAAALGFYRRLGYAETRWLPGYYDKRIAARRMHLRLGAAEP